jgi:signal transduction histidine kinase
MMHEFLTVNRSELAARYRSKVAERSTGPKEEELEHGISLFLEQVIKTLQVEQSSTPMDSRKISGPDDGKPTHSEIGDGATLHGRELLMHGFTVEEVVHDYGDLCQAVTDLAFERGVAINIDEFRTLNRCLDNAIAIAVTEFNYQRDFMVADQQAQVLNERLGSFAHEVRNLVSSATLALSAIKTGSVGLTGATGAVLDNSLVGLRHLIDRSFSEVRMTAGMTVHHELFSLTHFIAEVKLTASLEAQLRKCSLIVAVVDSQLAVDADRELLFSAVGNLLQNAFKFTRPQTTVALTAYAVADRILIEVQDKCGGLPPGEAEKMFLPFRQGKDDQSGLGLGLSIARRGVEINNGILTVRDMPGSGCVFTIDLPRHCLADSAILN